MQLKRLHVFTEFVARRAPEKMDGFVESDHDVIWFPVGPDDLPLTEEEQGMLGVYHDEENECWATVC